MDLLEKEGKKVLMIGNEAIARGALEAGVAIATTYPGTPASEIGMSFAKIAKQAGIYFEYSANEKVAFETAAGAALSGLKAIVSMKHYGLNVASDSIIPSAYLAIKGSLVIVVADDPSCWSSTQSEQDSRPYAKLAHLPMLEPSDVQEAKDMTKLAFEISSKYHTPVFVRTTTRLSHMRGVVKLGKLAKPNFNGNFSKGMKFRTVPPHVIETHKQIHKRLEKIAAISEKLCKVYNSNSKLGIITSGVSFDYLIEAMEKLKLKLPVLKIGMSYPLPEKKIASFIKGKQKVLVVEELEPIIEEEVLRIAKQANPKLVVLGKGLLPWAGEYRPEIIIKALATFAGKKLAFLKQPTPKVKERHAVLCPGCPHLASFYAAKQVNPNAPFPGDIGCYLIGVYPPYSMQDFFCSMGSSISFGHGIVKATQQKPIVFMGDSTFFHAGIPGLINAVYNQSNLLLIVLDNRYTAMTGHQPHPGTGITGMGEKTKALLIEEIAKACGADVKVVNTYNLKEYVSAIKELYKKQGVGVIVAKGECRLQTIRRLISKGIKIPKFQVVDQQKANAKKKELLSLGCQAIRVKKGNVYIDEDLCWGCSLCSQICKGIKVKL